MIFLFYFRLRSDSVPGHLQSSQMKSYAQIYFWGIHLYLLKEQRQLCIGNYVLGTLQTFQGHCCCRAICQQENTHCTFSLHKFQHIPKLKCHPINSSSALFSKTDWNDVLKNGDSSWKKMLLPALKFVYNL